MNYIYIYYKINLYNRSTSKILERKNNKRIKLAQLKFYGQIGGVKMKKGVMGFTLIELLAVIVILAIIALIATPIVINIINDS